MITIVTVLDGYSGGVPCTNWAMQVQLMAGALIVACFIFTRVYASVLTSSVTIPINQPLVNSVYDIPNKRSEIHVNVEKSTIADGIFQVNECSCAYNI